MTIRLIALIYNDFIKEKEASHRASVCVVTDISCLTVANRAEVLEEEVRSGHRNIVPYCRHKSEILSVFRHEDVDL